MNATTWSAVAQTQPLRSRPPTAPEHAVEPSRGQTCAICAELMPVVS
jgi:hypothetical protein